MKKIAKIIGKDEDIAEYDEKIKMRKGAIQAAYFNTFDGNFVMNVQGANSFAVDLGLGDKTTYAKMVSYYKKLGYFDTGIFATDVVIRTLFENGDAELAVDILTNDGDQGYEHWRMNGATTFHEYWDSNRSRSHCHPMFGAPVAYFFEYLLGIKQNKDSYGFDSITINPAYVDSVDYIKGHITTDKGVIRVAYEKVNGKAALYLNLPDGIRAKVRTPIGRIVDIDKATNARFV
jgi:alpha-L-rhamnosidase